MTFTSTSRRTFGAALRSARPRLASTLLGAIMLAGCDDRATTAIAPVRASAIHPAAFAPRRLDWHTGRIGVPASYHLPLGPALPATGPLLPGLRNFVTTIYVSDLGTNAVYTYAGTNPGAPLTTITAGISEPLGTCVDIKGQLYVTNLISNSVSVYPNGGITPSKTYLAGLSEPVSCAVGADGTLYVAEFENGEVVIYAPGSRKPERTLAVAAAEGVAVDADNNLYVSNNATGQGAVEEFAPGSSTGTTLGIGVSFAGDLRVDLAGDIILEDQLAQTVNYYPSGQTSPSGSLALTGFDPYKLTLSANEKLLLVATLGGEVALFTAGPKGKPAGTVTQGLVEASGVSVWPAPFPTPTPQPRR